MREIDKSLHKTKRKERRGTRKKRSKSKGTRDKHKMTAQQIRRAKLEKGNRNRNKEAGPVGEKLLARRDNWRSKYQVGTAEPHSLRCSPAGTWQVD